MKLTLILVAILAVPAMAQSDPSQEVLRQRQQLVAAILTTDRLDLVQRQRWLCINGREPASVREARAGGDAFTPDASDSCIAALKRSAKDQNLFGAYQKLMRQLGGDPATYQTLPKAIGSAVLGGKTSVSIGGGESADVTSELAFDAGFTTAYTDGATKKAGVDQNRLKTVTERCLSAQSDAATCFSVGYIQGALAFNAR